MLHYKTIILNLAWPHAKRRYKKAPPIGSTRKVHKIKNFTLFKKHNRVIKQGMNIVARVNV